MRLHFIRHGEVESRYQQFFGGSRIEMELSPHGHSQAQALAQWLADTRFHAVFASPMVRVKQTYTPLAEKQGFTPIILDDLREVDFGDWTGLRWSEVHERYGVHAHDWLAQLERGLPNGESAAGLLARVKPCLDRILATAHEASAQADIAVFCHGGIVRALLALMLEAPMQSTARFAVEYASVTTVVLSPERSHGFEIRRLNATAPLL